MNLEGNKSINESKKENIDTGTLRGSQKTPLPEHSTPVFEDIGASIRENLGLPELQ